MKKLFITSFLLVLAVSAFSQKSPAANDIVGVWISNLEKSHVEITKDSVDGKYYGKIIWLKAPKYPDGSDKMDKNNPDKTKTTQPLMGLVVLKDLSFVKDHWEGGNIYDPESGKTYSCKATLKGTKLELRGYVGISQIGRTQTWDKIVTTPSNRATQ